MSELYGQNLSRREIMSRVGDISQIARATEFRFENGRAEGMRGIEVVTGSGLSYTVTPSRCLDIAWVNYKGTPIASISKSGLSAPAFFEKDGLLFLRNFSCGLLSTCGLTYMGAPCVDNGEELGLHGRIGNIPAQNTYAVTEWEGDELVIRVGGQVRESCIFGENIVLTREIKSYMGSNIISIHDSIHNEGFSPAPLMLLYHFNFGYPLLREDSKLDIPGKEVRPRDDRAKEGIDEWMNFNKPVPGFTEQVYYHNPNADENGFVKAGLLNPVLGIGMYMKYNKNALPYLVEWKQIGEGDYVVGVEPGTWLPEGRAKARELNQLKMIAPDETYETHVEIEIDDL